MYEVLFNLTRGTDIDHHATDEFISSVPDHPTAQRIARNLEDEGFVAHAWVVEM